MIDFFKQLPKKLKSLDKGFRDIFFGIGDEFKYLGIGTARGFEDIGLLIAYASQFVFSYTMCGVKYISNIPNCILYYTVDYILYYMLLYGFILEYILYMLHHIVHHILVWYFVWYFVWYYIYLCVCFVWYFVFCMVFCILCFVWYFVWYYYIIF